MNSPSKNQGAALIVALVMLSMVTLVAGVLLRSVQQQEKVTLSNTLATRAQFAAELALRDAVLRLLLPPSNPNSIVRPPVNSPEALSVFATGSFDDQTEYNYNYSIEYKKENDPNNTALERPALTEKNQAIFLIKAEGRSGPARRRVEIAIVDTYVNSPFGFGLIGCEGVWLDAGAETRSLNSIFDTYPLTPIAKSYDFGNNGSILTLNSNINVVDGKKIRGNIEVNSGLVRGNIISGGTVKVSSGTVRGYITAENTVTLDGDTTVLGDVYGNPIDTSAKIFGRIQVSDRPLYETQEDCDVLKVDNIINEKTTQARNNNNNNEVSVSYLNPSNNNLSATGTSKNPITINLGQPNTEKTYFISNATIGEHVNLNINGTVNLVMTGNLNMISDKTKLNIANNASLRIYTAGSIILDKAEFNYVNNTAKPTSLIIYSNVSDGNTVPTVANAKIQLAAPNTIFRGLVYAPKAFIRVKSNNSLYGALRGKWIRMESNTAFTYDIAAATIDAERQGYRMIYWNEPSYDSYQ